MFEDARFQGTPKQDKKLYLHTKLGSKIECLMGAEATTQCQKKFEILSKQYGGNWEIRKPATGGYNCAGLVWSSRRFVIARPNDWETILEEDGYRTLEEGETMMVGDIVVYYEFDEESNTNKEIIHIAKVCAIDRLMTDSAGSLSKNFTPKALSKWDLSSGESIHRIPDVHLNGGVKFQFIFYTDRPKLFLLRNKYP